jgi:insertion element IS1 protein InsB
MVIEPICCPDCHSTDIVKHGRTTAGKQRYYRGQLKEVKQQISDMALNGSGIRDTARVLKMSTTTVIDTLKKVTTPRTSKHSFAATATTR